MSYKDIRLDRPAPAGFRLRAWLRRSALGRRLYRRRWRRRADVYLISFPKAGRTWVRLLLARALALHFGVQGGDLLDLDGLAGRHPDIPRIRPKHDDDPQLKTPGELVRTKEEYADSKVILLVRDLRDLAVSTYFQMTRRERRYQGDLASFLGCQRGSVDTMIRFYNVWAENRNAPRDFLLVRYEDLHRDTPGELRRMLDFIGLPEVDDETVAAAVEFGRFDNMRRLESTDAAASGRLRPANAGDPESYKTRRGQVGGFGDYLTDEQIAWLDARIARELSPLFGYWPR